MHIRRGIAIGLIEGKAPTSPHRPHYNSLGISEVYVSRKQRNQALIIIRPLRWPVQGLMLRVIGAGIGLY